LSTADAGKLCCYFHFREPILLNQKTLLQKASLDKSIDFLDPIDADIPKGGSWSVQYEKGCGLVTLRSLHWLGFIFYHVPETRKFGCVYVGTGEKNLDLPFML
ncbi:radial spoke head 9 homolog, partial [Paramuricea clavata]